MAANGNPAHGDWEKAARAKSHCGAGERLVFNCHAGKKVASVCAVALPSGAFFPKYRFGTLGSVELELPQHPSSSSVTYKFDDSNASGYAAYLRFNAGDYAYFAYEASFRGPNASNGASTRVRPFGVLVAKGERPLQRLKCAQGFVALSNPESLLGIHLDVQRLAYGEGIDAAEIVTGK